MVGESNIDTEHVNLTPYMDIDKVQELVMDQLVARKDVMKDAVQVSYQKVQTQDWLDDYSVYTIPCLLVDSGKEYIYVCLCMC